MHDDAIAVVVVPAELMAGNDHGHLLVADGLEVALQLDEAVGRDAQHDDQRHDRPRDLEAGVAVDLGRHVAGRLAGAAVADRDPQQRRLDAEEDDDRRDRDIDVGVVDALPVGRDRVRKDGVEAADIAGAENEGECGKASD